MNPDYERMEQSRQLMLLLRRCGHHIWHRQAGKSSQENVIRILFQAGEMTQAELQKRLRIQQASVSELVGKLVDQGLVTRERDEQDRRRITLRLTEAGKAADGVNQERNMRRDFDLLRSLSEEERQELKHILTKLLCEWDAPGCKRE